jgi:hypothetical protein
LMVMAMPPLSPIPTVSERLAFPATAESADGDARRQWYRWLASPTSPRAASATPSDTHRTIRENKQCRHRRTNGCERIAGCLADAMKDAVNRRGSRWRFHPKNPAIA